MLNAFMSVSPVFYTSYTTAQCGYNSEDLAPIQI